MFRHRWNLPLRFRENGCEDSTGSVVAASIIGAVIIAFGSLFIIGLPLQAIFSTIGQESPGVIAETATLVSVVLWLIFALVLPVTHVLYGLNGRRRRSMQTYLDLPARARRSLPKAAEFRQALIEANYEEVDNIYNNINRLSSSAHSMERTTAVVSSPRVRALMETLDVQGETFAILAEEYRKIDAEQEYLRD